MPYLRAWRMYHALTQADLAEQSGLNRLTISSAEAGGRLSFANIRKVAECLGISVQQLLREDPNGAQRADANVEAKDTNHK